MPIDWISARRFLDLFAEHGDITYQVFSDDKRSKEAWHETPSDLDEIADRLEAANNRGCGVYFMVNVGDGKGRKSENVTKVRALFIDLDNAPLEPVTNARLEPHIVIESSPGRYQAFYFVSDCPLESFTEYQKALIKKFNADPSIHELARVMRIPGFYHKKGIPFQVRIVKLNQYLPYTIEQLASALSLSLDADCPDNKPLPPLITLKPKSITVGERHSILLRYAVKYANLGHKADEIYLLLQTINTVYCMEPKPDSEIARIVQFALTTTPPPVNLPPLPPQESTKLTEPPPNIESDSVALPEELINCAPGLVGEIAAWINETSIYHHPALSLAAAITFVGALKAHRVSTSTNLRTNILALGVAPSGAGKNHAMECIERLAKAASVDGIIGGRPASDAGLLKSMQDGNGRRLILWDELGLALQEITNPKAAGYKAAILRAMMEMFSKAGSTYRGVEYSNQDNRRQRTDIDQPCLCVYGASTPGRFYDALSSSHAVDGFLARLLVFETTQGYPTRRKIKTSKIPDSLIIQCRVIQRLPTNVTASPESSDSHLSIDPAVIPLDPDAEALFDEALVTFDKKRQEAGKRLEALESLWSRAGEHAIKLALVVESNPTIQKVTLEWAIEVVSVLVDNLTRSVEMRIADSGYEKELKKIHKFIRSFGVTGTTARAIYRKFHLQPRRTNDILLSLVHSGLIDQRDAPNYETGRPRKLFVAINDEEL